MSAAQITPTEPETIYVRLTDEAVCVWRPAVAKKIEDRIYCILPQIYNPDIETWEFLPGEMVRVELQKKSEGEVLVAVERIREI